ncbi:hypothetical protein F66182_10327 [Fusarium sp. NRRL 66182]|nr:hypothetical protein F66182_10327 [Fusarium sp. NRRL 66182]
MPVSLSPPSLLAIATGIAGSAWVSGAIAGASLMAVPAALSAPSTSATVWQEIFNRGIALMPKLAATTAASYLYGAFSAHQDGRSWKGLATSALLTVAIVPYTILFMSSTNNFLFKAASGTLGASQDEVSRLIGRWGVLNLGRSLLPLAGTVVGFSALIQSL